MTAPAIEGMTVKAHRAGTHRVIPPEETVERVRPMMPAMGITRIANVTGLDCVGIPVVMVCRPNARSLAVSQGKGLTLAAAKASGLMESVESYHAETIKRPLIYGSYQELRRTHCLIDVAQLPRRTDSLFHLDRPLLWIEGFDLIQDEPVWVPFELVHLNYTLDPVVETANFGASSNGLASGNHLLEAISHGICEIVENDATVLARLADPQTRSSRRLDLSTVDDPGCREVLEKFERAEVAVAVWDTTSDVGLPSFECAIVNRAENRFRDLYPAGGSGCHPAREIALLRALTEAAQSRVTFISGSRDDLFRHRYDNFGTPEYSRLQRSRLEADRPTRHFHEAPTWDHDTFDEDVAWEVRRLSAAGFERVVIVDLTQPELRLPVVRVVIPGMEYSEAVPKCRPSDRAQRIRERST